MIIPYFFYIYVVGQDDQPNDKVGQDDQLCYLVGQDDQLCYLVGHENRYPPQPRALRSSPDVSPSVRIPAMWTRRAPLRAPHDNYG